MRYTSSRADGRDPPAATKGWRAVSIVELLRSEEEAILDEALPEVGWLGEDGERDGGQTRARLASLHRLVEEAARSGDGERLTALARRLETQGREAGEIRSAFAALEEAIWHHAFAWMPPSEWAGGLRPVATALDRARDALSRASRAA